MTPHTGLALLAVPMAAFIGVILWPAFSKRSFERRTAKMGPVRRCAFFWWLRTCLWTACSCLLLLLVFLVGGFKQDKLADWLTVGLLSFLYVPFVGAVGGSLGAVVGLIKRWRVGAAGSGGKESQRFGEPVGESKTQHQSILRRGFVAFARIAALFVAIVVAYPAWSWWNVRQLQSFCSAVSPGTPVSELIGLAEQHGYDRHWVERGLQRKADDAKVIHVPSLSTLGEVTCDIHHDGSVVTSAGVND